MAYDKNYSDICSDSIIAPALKYYMRPWNHDNKLKVNYYRGIVGRNKGDIEEAMNYYTIAERHAPKCTNYLAVGRVYNARMNIYVELFEYRAAYESAEKAAIVYYKANDIIKFYDATLDVLHAGLVLNLGEYEQSIKIIQEGWEHLKDEQRARYYLIILSYELFQEKSRMLLEDYFRIEGEWFFIISS